MCFNGLYFHGAHFILFYDTNEKRSYSEVRGTSISMRPQHTPLHYAVIAILGFFLFGLDLFNVFVNNQQQEIDISVNY